LIHDLGKLMYLHGSDEDGTSAGAQWGMVGDT
jgi:inositol oxygenase